ncbi:MAG: acyl-CoA thioesterase [Leptolyngbyaceae cyanobacterium]
MVETSEINKVVFKIPTYSFQIDANGHVNNAVYVQWIEVGLQKIFTAADLPITLLRKEGILPVVADTQISYKTSLFDGDTVRVEVWLSAFKYIYAWAEFRFYNSDEILVATGRQCGTFVSLSNQKVRKLSANQYSLMSKFLIPA